MIIFYIFLTRRKSGQSHRTLQHSDVLCPPPPNFHNIILVIPIGSLQRILSVFSLAFQMSYTGFWRIQQRMSFRSLWIKVGQNDVAIYCVGVTVSFESEFCNKGESWRLCAAYWPLQWHWKVAQCHALRLRVTTELQLYALALGYRPLPSANVFQLLCLEVHDCG